MYGETIKQYTEMSGIQDQIISNYEAQGKALDTATLALDGYARAAEAVVNNIANFAKQWVVLFKMQ